MWDPQDFERHWRAEFPGEEVPVMQLDSVLDMERELERSKLKLKWLQQVLAEEKFKAVYLQAALEKRDLGCGRPGGGLGDYPRGPSLPDPAVAANTESPPYACLDLPTWPGAAGAGGAVRSLTAAIHQQLLQPRLLFRPREDCAPPGHHGTAPGARREERSAGLRAGRGSEEGEADAASGADDGGDSSDHDFEMVDLNEKFALSQLLVAPCRPGTCDEAEKPARAYGSHRWMHLILGGRRQWRRKRFLGLPERDSPSHSSPERGSDCSRNSSDHEDGSFAEGSAWSVSFLGA
nr:PREDICTED: breakpoint cluster region protein-like [Bos indicus]